MKWNLQIKKDEERVRLLHLKGIIDMAMTSLTASREALCSDF